MSLRKVTWLLAVPALLLVAGLTAWAWLMHSESGARWLLARLEASIPGSLTASTISGDLGSGLQLDGIHFDDASMRVDVGRLKIAIDIDLFPLTVGLDTVHADSVVVRVLQASDQETDRENTTQEISIPVPVNFPDIRISGIEYFDLSGDRALIIHLINAAGSLHRDLALNLDISSPQLQLPLGDPESETKLTDLEAHIRGELPKFNLDLAANLELQGLESSRLELAGNGTESDFTAHHLSLKGTELSLEATGAVSWKNELHVELSAALGHLDPGKWLEDWPEAHPVSGDLSMELSGDELNVSSFALAVARTSMMATGRGVIDIQSGIVDAELNWNDFSWPPGNPDPVMNSKSGSFAISGQPEDWKLEGSLDFQAGELPEGQVRMNGTGDMESLDVTIHEATVLGGTLAGDIDWNWTQSQPFNARLTMDGIDITPLAPQYPGVLNAQLTASGELEPFRLGVELQQLDGVIKGYPVAASGGFHIEQDHVYADRLNLRTGASTLSLNGNLYEPGGIDFSADIDSLARFSDELDGNLIAEGTLSLDPESPKFIATLSAQQLLFGQVPIESLTARFGGQEPLQHIVINALAQGMEAGLEMSISVTDWADPLASHWNGSLSELRLDHNGQLILALDQPATLEGDLTHFRLEQACFSGVRDTHMCMGSSWHSPDGLSFSANLAALPVGFLELFIDMEVKFTQVLSGTLNWSQKAGGDRNGEARIDISPGVIQESDGDEVLLETGPGLFAFELDGGQLRKGDLDLNFPGSGDIDIDFSVRDLSLGRQSPVQGTARIDLNDIGAVGAIFPLFDTIDGVLDVDMSLSGTLSDPDFKGRAILTNGELANLASGFSFSAINLSGEVSEFDRSELKGSFRAGEGSGKISMTIYFEDILAPVINLALEGESLTLIDVPDLKMIANPDMELHWQDKALEISGRLLIPTARLSPSYIPKSSVGQSEDVVIVAGELPVVEKDFLQANAIKFRGNLEVELGEDVVIDLEVAQINVTGVTRFTWQDDVIPIADGSYNATGDIQAYGQFLRITRGRISFPGIPADNPHLNIRAEREIFGNAQIRRAGLMVAGTLRRPVIEAYTVPMTNKHRAQTLLVTGSDFNYEQGVGAVDVGMYVLPRLYISYGIGVFEDGNVIKARYDLGRGFGIRATSGQRETGLDISYTIER
jgi:translocation and assembly module TamB